ncbi:MAG: HAMP domain-containing protein [Phycisphaerales bacterium]|nr:HAMP domain-containing protein [Phycisphaerales bacterium]
MLISLLGLSVVLSLGFAAWSVQTVSEEVSSAYSDLTFVLDQLDRIKQAFEHDLAAINKANDGGPALIERIPLEAQIDPVVEALRTTPGFRRRVGESTSTLLMSLVSRCKSLMGEYQDATFTAPPLPIEHPVRAGAQAQFEATHALIERVQAQLLRDVEISLVYGRDLRAMLLRIIAASLAFSVLVALLALILVRRWVLAPITSLRQATSELAAGNLGYRLEVRSADEFGQLSGEVNHMAEMVVAAQQRLVERERLAAVGELVRRLAHNLRNPLAGIRGLAELTLGELPADSELAENQTRIVGAVDRFEKWLAELLRSTSPMKLQRETVGSRELFDSLQASHAPMARSRKITLELRDAGLPPSFHVDAAQMEHALVAIISNAIEAAPEGGTVRVTGGVEEALQGPMVFIRVEDSGAGVAPEAMGRLFTPHFTTKKHGTGIGLAVAHNVITAHGGRIRVDRSADLGGAAFIVTFPVAGGA